MKQLCSTKRIDELGRIVIPSDVRKTLNINTNDILDIYLNDNEIIINKHKFNINYEELIKSLLINNYGNKYIDILITDKDINEFIEIVNKYIEKLK